MLVPKELERSLPSFTRVTCGVIVDLDETVFNPLHRWIELIAQRMNVRLAMEDIERAGSLDQFFANNPRHDEFVEIAQELRGDKALYSDVRVIDGAGAALAKMSETDNVQLLAYLTARPTNVISTTTVELQKHNLPNLPILARPEDIGFYSSSSWKLRMLIEMQNAFSGVLLMIDDNIQVSDSIRRYNQLTPERFIVSILFNGPLTHNYVSSRNLRSIPGQHFFVSGWDKIPDICEMYAKPRNTTSEGLQK